MKADHLRTAGKLTYGGLAIDEDLSFAKKEWRVQRVGWAMLALFIVAGTLGVFGKGVLSRASSAGEGVRVQYERLERFQRPTTVRVQVTSPAATSSGIFIDQGYLDAIRIERVVPQPETIQANGRGLVFSFANTGNPFEVAFHIQLEQFGPVTGQIGVQDARLLTFSQFVYP